MVFNIGAEAISVDRRVKVKIIGWASNGDYACEVSNTGVLFFAPENMLRPIDTAMTEPVTRWIALWEGGYLGHGETSPEGEPGVVAAVKVTLTPGHFDPKD